MTTSGQLNRRLTFQARVALHGGDGAGNFEAAWVDQFTVSARVQPRFGGEAVLASRLTGTQPVTITVRRSTSTRRIAADWRAIDARDGAVYALTSPAMDPAEDGAWLEMMATAGRAA
ncbi:head-tail adaptor protein [Xanthobacter sp. V2C-8]|uniref:head-tail adaptor protein n=1 Tax=Xanthobacter albus TaxID=3119929 RepID=UPI003727C82B